MTNVEEPKKVKCKATRSRHITEENEIMRALKTIIYTLKIQDRGSADVKIPYCGATLSIHIDIHDGWS